VSAKEQRAQIEGTLDRPLPHFLHDSERTSATNLTSDMQEYNAVSDKEATSEPMLPANDRKENSNCHCKMQHFIFVSFKM
jgi:hypothetical protein